MQESHNYNLSATDSKGNNWTLALAFVPGSESSFDSEAALTAQETTTISVNGTLANNDVTTMYFNIGPFTHVGGVDQNGEVTVFANQTALPQLATVGQSGAFDTFTVYTDNTRATVYATGTETWALNQLTSDTASFCFNIVDDFASGTTTTQSTCYQIDERGDALGLQLNLDVNGTVLDFQ